MYELASHTEVESLHMLHSTTLGSVVIGCGASTMQVCRRLNQVDQAVQAFSRALALNPSAADASVIKSAIEKIQTGEGDDDDEMS